ncbi:MAG TPA: transposase [Ktedonobacterales bacterium]
MVGRGELTDQAWSSVEPLMPTSRRRGGQWQDHRTVINGIVWKLRAARRGGICLSATGRGRRVTQLQAVLKGIRVPRPAGRGRPRPRPDRLIADNGYRYPRCRRWLRQRQIPHTIPERRDQRAQRAVRPGRPLRFDKAIYARRNVVERCLNRLKQWRGLTTRHEKRAVNYRAMLVLASIVLWLEG